MRSVNMVTYTKIIKAGVLHHSLKQLKLIKALSFDE